MVRRYETDPGKIWALNNTGNGEVGGLRGSSKDRLDSDTWSVRLTDSKYRRTWFPYTGSKTQSMYRVDWLDECVHPLYIAEQGLRTYVSIIHRHTRYLARRCHTGTFYNVESPTGLQSSEVQGVNMAGEYALRTKKILHAVIESSRANVPRKGSDGQTYDSRKPVAIEHPFLGQLS